MNKNIMIVLGGAVLVAFLMAILVQVMLGGGARKEAPVAVVKKEPTVSILIAAKDMKIGDKPKGESVKWKSWPKKSLIPDMIVRKEKQKAEEAVSSRLRKEVEEGKPILQSYFMDNETNFVAASLEPGMRAVSIQVSAETMVAGFIAAGDNVDIVLSYQEEITTATGEDPRVIEMLELSLDKLAVETILQNVRILAVDQMSEPGEDRVKVGRTVTLALTALDAEKVILAQQMGTLTLVLRGPEDKDTTPRKGPIVSDARLVKIDDELTNEYKKLKDETGIQVNNVRIYNGNEVQVISTQ